LSWLFALNLPIGTWSGLAWRRGLQQRLQLLLEVHRGVDLIARDIAPPQASEASGLKQIQQLPIFIDEPVAFAGASGPRLGRAKGIGLVVFFLVALPAAELVLPLDHDAGHAGAMGNGAQYQLGAARSSSSSCEPQAVLSGDGMNLYRV